MDNAANLIQLGFAVVILGPCIYALIKGFYLGFYGLIPKEKPMTLGQQVDQAIRDAEMSGYADGYQAGGCSCGRC